MSEEHVHEVTGRPYLYVSMGPRRIQRFLYAMERKIQPWLCKIGLHDVHDVGEADGSVITGYCGDCEKLTKPRKAMPPSDATVLEYEKLNAWSAEYCEKHCGCKDE